MKAQGLFSGRSVVPLWQPVSLCRAVSRTAASGEGSPSPCPASLGPSYLPSCSWARPLLSAKVNWSLCLALVIWRPEHYLSAAPVCSAPHTCLLHAPLSPQVPKLRLLYKTRPRIKAVPQAGLGGTSCNSSTWEAAKPLSA